MKKNTLYTANKYNRDAFARYLDRENQNIFDGDPYYPSDLWDTWNNQYVNPLERYYLPPESAVSRILQDMKPLSLPGVETSLEDTIKKYPISELKHVDVPIEDTKTPFLQTDVGKGVAAAGVSALGSVFAPVVQAGYSAGTAGKIANTAAPMIGAAIGSIFGGPLGAAVGGAAGKLIGAGVNRTFGYKTNAQNKAKMDSILGGMKANNNIQLSTAGVRDQARRMVPKLDFNKGWIAKDGIFSNKGKKLERGYREAQNVLADNQWASFRKGINQANRIEGDMAYLDSFAYGGPMGLIDTVDPSTAIGYDFMNTYLTNRKGNDAAKGSTLNSPFAGVSSGVLGNTMAKGGKIEIKHPGRLTELKKRTGKTEAQLWAEGDPEVRKMITFARNARKWKKAYGGYLDATDNLFAAGGMEELGPEGIQGVGYPIQIPEALTLNPSPRYVPNAPVPEDDEGADIATQRYFEEGPEPSVSREEVSQAIQQKAYDNLEFGDARNAALRAGKATFWWRGKEYVTNGNKRSYGGLLDEGNIYALGGESFPSDMTLEEAFEKAREKGQEYFYFNGKRYSTGLTSDSKTYAEGGNLNSSENSSGYKKVRKPIRTLNYFLGDVVIDKKGERPSGVRYVTNEQAESIRNMIRQGVPDYRISDEVTKMADLNGSAKDIIPNIKAEGGSMDSQASMSDYMQGMQQGTQQEGEPELVYEAGQEFPSGIWRFPDGTFQAANAKGERITLTEEQVKAYIEMDQKRKAQQAQQQQFAEGGPMEGAPAQMPQQQMPPQGTPQEMPQEGMENAEVPMEGGSQVQEEAPTEEPTEEEEPEEELPELGEVLDVTPEEAEELKAMGYEFKVIKK